jgi:hypothetical protein
MLPEENQIFSRNNPRSRYRSNSLKKSREAEGLVDVPNGILVCTNIGRAKTRRVKTNQEAITYTNGKYRLTIRI